MVRAIGFAAVLFSGCATTGNSDEAAGSDGSAGWTSSATEGDGSDQSGAGQAASLTAGAWDDNQNSVWFERWLADVGGMPGAPNLDLQEREASYADFGGDRASRERLDIAILLDTTGSMADEHLWLTEELGAIAQAIDAFAPNAELRWSLVVYRDHGDDYLTRSTDFTSSLPEFQAALAREEADGGGDYPEAVEAGLADVLDLSWRTDPDVARLVFWVADAPPHIDDGAVVSDLLREARASDVHIYPVAASGADDLTQLTMRSAAQLTGGRYLFLTDDSGIGENHDEPTIPCYFVTLLSDAMLRMVEIELTGIYAEPDPAEILRTGGNPASGVCTLDDGEVVIAF